MTGLKLTLGVATVLSMASPYALAADLGPLSPEPSALPSVMSELGTGWYVRGDAGFVRASLPKISPDLNFSGNSPTRNSWSLGFGAGYKFNNWFRADVEYDYRNKLKSRGQGGLVACQSSVNPAVFYIPGCTVSQQTKQQAWDVMANGYVDLGQWSGISPYVGAGVGLSKLHTSGTVSYAAPGGGLTAINYNKTINSKNYQVAWALMTGVGVDIAPHITLDIGYRYLNLGKSKGVSAINGSFSSQSIVEQEFRVGLRYMID